MDYNFYYYVNGERQGLTLEAPKAYTAFDIIRRHAGFNYLDVVKITYKVDNQEKELKDNHNIEIVNGVEFTVERVIK